MKPYPFASLNHLTVPCAILPFLVTNWFPDSDRTFNTGKKHNPVREGLSTPISAGPAALPAEGLAQVALDGPELVALFGGGEAGREAAPLGPGGAADPGGVGRARRCPARPGARASRSARCLVRVKTRTLPRSPRSRDRSRGVFSSRCRG